MNKLQTVTLRTVSLKELSDIGHLQTTQSCFCPNIVNIDSLHIQTYTKVMCQRSMHNALNYFLRLLLISAQCAMLKSWDIKCFCIKIPKLKRFIFVPEVDLIYDVYNNFGIRCLEGKGSIIVGQELVKFLCRAQFYRYDMACSP